MTSFSMKPYIRILTFGMLLMLRVAVSSARTGPAMTASVRKQDKNDFVRLPLVFLRLFCIRSPFVIPSPLLKRGWGWGVCSAVVMDTEPELRSSSPLKKGRGFGCRSSSLNSLAPFEGERVG